MTHRNRRKNRLRLAAARIARRFRYRSEKAVRYGLTIVIVVSLPFVYLIAFEATPEEYQSYFILQRPGTAAVRAMAGPGASAGREVRTPDFVKGIYITTSTVGRKARFDQLVSLVEDTELNALVIDIKDHRGAIAFVPQAEDLKPYVADNPELGDLQELTAPLREKGIYLIARLFVFQDPHYAEANPDLAVGKAWGAGIWRDYRGIPWLDPAAKKVWQYNAAVAKEAFDGGFDEIQFDYIRFPSDGSLSTMVFPVWDGVKPKSEVMGEFFTYLDNELRVKNGIKTSVDLFGLTMWQHEYDLNIGQRLREAMPHFDYISPMVYPSHYPDGFNGYANPAVRPYDVVYWNMVRGQEFAERLAEEVRAADPEGRSAGLATFRPWLQDFDLGAVYTADRVRGQMTATQEGGGSGWLLWNAANRYTESVLLPAETDEENITNNDS